MRALIAVLNAFMIAVLIVPAASAVPAGAGARPLAAACPGAAAGDHDDVDGDGVFDPVVGVPGAGEVDVHGSASGNHVLGGRSADPQASSAFGSAVAQFDANGDGCDDLAVGDPGRPGGGAVTLLFGSPGGVRAAGAVTIPARTAADRYGSAVAVDVRRAADGSGAVAGVDLWVGAPGRTVAGLAGAGAVDHYTLDAAGVPTFLGSVSGGSALLPAAAHAGDHFGAALHARSSSTGERAAHLVVGAPDAAVDGRAAAGSVSSLWVGPGADATPRGGQTITQDTPGVAGVAEPGDHFGAAVADDLVGVPGEDLGAARDAGMVERFDVGTSSERFATAYTQETAGVPGRSETGDRFGASVASQIVQFIGFDDDGLCEHVWIGVPGEGLGAAAGAGYVLTAADHCATEDVARPAAVAAGTQFRTLRQGPGGNLPGVYEAGDGVGAALAPVRCAGPAVSCDPGTVRCGTGPCPDEPVLIGDPGEDVGTVRDAGLALFSGVGSSATVGASTGAAAGRRYGTVLAQELDTNLDDV